MPREFIRTSEPFLIRVREDGSYDEIPADGPDADPMLGEQLYVRGVELSWGAPGHLQLGVGVFTFGSHENVTLCRDGEDGEYKLMTFTLDNDDVTRRPLAHFVHFGNDGRWGANQLVKLMRRARNVVYGADE
jgi:hypothetical protein